MAVAVFNIVTTLVMTVADKSSDIAILKTLGAKTSVIMKIFVIYGSMIGFLGTFAGFCLGLLIAENVSVIMPFIEGFFGVDLLAKDVYYIDEIPSKVQMSDIIWIVGISFIMSVLATIYPSIRAARTVPVEILRHE